MSLPLPWRLWFLVLAAGVVFGWAEFLHAGCPSCGSSPCVCGGGTRERGGGGGVGIGINIDLSTIGRREKEEDPFGGSSVNISNDPEPVRPRPPPPPPQWRILDIHPVQVVQSPFHEAPTESIPLVEEKNTMVRVFVQMPDNLQHTDDAVCILRWNGQEVRQRASLFRRGRTYVYGDDSSGTDPDNPASPGAQKTAAIKSQLADGNAAAADRILNNQGDRDRHWAFNFQSASLPEEGRAPASLELEAELLVNGVSVAKRKERSGTEFKIKPFTFHDGNFHLTVGGVVTDILNDNEIKEINDANMWSRKAKQYKREIAALYPVPLSRFRIRILYSYAFMLWGVDDGTVFSGTCEFYMERYPDADAIIFVAPNNFTPWTVGWAGVEYEGFTPVTSGTVHMIGINQSASGLVAPHEIGHQDRFFGGGHLNDRWDNWIRDGVEGGYSLVGDLMAKVTGNKGYSSAGKMMGQGTAQAFERSPQTVEDGWDVLGVLGNPNTVRGRNSLMVLQGNQAPSPWIDLTEYRKLLNIMVTGGADPLLARFSGVIWNDGTIEAREPWLAMGYPPLPSRGILKLRFLDKNGRTLGETSFNPTLCLPPPNKRSASKPRLGAWFSVQTLLPEGTAKAELRNPKEVLHTWTAAVKPPALEIREVMVNETIRLATCKVNTTKPDRLIFRWVSKKYGNFYLIPDPARSRPQDGFYCLPLNLVAGGEGRLAVSVNDRMRFVELEKGPYVLPNAPPWHVGCMATDDGQNLEAVGFDPEDDVDLKYSWTVGKNEAVATGTFLPTNWVYRAIAEKLPIRIRGTDQTGLFREAEYMASFTKDGKSLQATPRIPLVPAGWFQYLWIAALALVLSSLAVLRVLWKSGRKA